MGREGSTRTALAPGSPERGRPGALRAHGQPHPRAPRSRLRREKPGGDARLGTKDLDVDPRRAPPPGWNPPGASSPWPRASPNFVARGARGRRPVTCAAIKDRSMVSPVSLPPPALESSLPPPPLRVQPPAPLAASGPSSEQGPRTPPRRPPQQPRRRGLGSLRAPRSGPRPGRGGGRGGAGLGGPGAPPRDRSQPHPKGGARRNPRAPKSLSRVGAAGGS
ncbi:proline-rich protein 2-like [Panthera uncia]|uniref:proline-rich protein 2-like n=1 Tax=Panthera uncia TaxID=29064 RepID=UPI0020FF85D1|nr:proline-rich protein 2-like [Panthera uncia]